MNCSSDVKICSTTVEEIGYLYLIPITCGLGVVFNIINLCVFFKSSFKTQMPASILTYLKGLAIADLLSALLILPTGFARCLNAPTKELQYALNFYLKYLYTPLANIFITTSVWITCAVTAERFWFLYYSGKRVIGSRAPSTVRKVILLFFILATVVCFPLLFYYDKISDDHLLQTSDFGESTGYEVYAWFRTFVAKIIPIIFVTVLNFGLIKIMRTSTKAVKTVVVPFAVLESIRKSQNRMTVLLLNISTVFVMSHILEPFCHSSVFSSLFGECSVQTHEYQQFKMFGNLFETISFASNFVTYCIFHRIFLMHILCLKTRKVSHKTLSCSLQHTWNVSSHRNVSIKYHLI